MTHAYVEKQDGSYQIAGTSVSLDSVVHAYLNGQSAESIAQSFPTLTLEQVHGALAFYRANQAQIDAYLQTRRADYDEQRHIARAGPDVLPEAGQCSADGAIGVNIALQLLHRTSTKSVAVQVGKVEALFALRDRGIVVVTDTSYDQLPADLAVTIGSAVEFRDATGVLFVAQVEGIEHSDPWTPRHKFAFLLSDSVSKDQIPIGLEIWSLSPPAANT